jgi:hypothetical protein
MWIDHLEFLIFGLALGAWAHALLRPHADR